MNTFRPLNTYLLALVVMTIFICNAQDEKFVMSQVGNDNLLFKPWDLVYGSDDYLWVTERESGTVSRIDPETGEKDVLITIPDVYAGGGQDGLLGLALHNEFMGDSAYVYVSYTRLLRGKRRQRLVRYTYEQNGNDGTLSSPQIVIDNMPGSDDHNSGRLIFGNDNKLYYTIGDQGERNCGSNLAQFLPTQEEINSEDWSDYPGKVLRLNTDGSIPADNPVINGVQSHIYSYGHRNPQGLVMSSKGILYSDEHGPSSDDEANLIIGGKNYGWPYVAGIKDNLMYDDIGCLTNETEFNDPNYQDPLLSLFTPDTEAGVPCSDNWMCRPNIAPSSLDVYENSAIPGWENSLLLTSLKRGRVYRLQLNASGDEVIGEVTNHFYTQNRYRDIAISPDGKSIYIITDESGNTADASGYNRADGIVDPGVILKFTYEGPLSVSDEQLKTPIKVYPNPASEVLKIQLDATDGNNYSVQLINTKGQVVNEKLELQAGENVLNVENFPAGIYILKVNGASTSWRERVILN